jgi:hypothetical protein
MILKLLFYPLLALEVLVQGPNMPDVQFEKQLMQNPQAQSYIQHSRSQNQKAEKELIEQLKKSQYEFLKGSLEKAKALYKEMAQKQHQEHWSKKARQAIHYSQLRLAQMTESPQKKQHWIQQALIFDPSIAVDTQVFPPPLVSEYKKQKESLGLQVWALPKNADAFTKILINGVEQENQGSFLRYRSGLVKISFFSNRYHSVHLTTDLKNLDQMTLPLNPLAQGDCETPQWTLQNKSQATYQLLDKDCQSLAAAQGVQTPLTWSANETAPRQEKSSKAFYQSTWFWVGVSVLATGLTIHAVNQQNRGSVQQVTLPQQPSAPTRYEFTNE